jgi:hypothetical protein
MVVIGKEGTQSWTQIKRTSVASDRILRQRIRSYHLYTKLELRDLGFVEQWSGVESHLLQRRSLSAGIYVQPDRRYSATPCTSVTINSPAPHSTHRHKQRPYIGARL